MANIKHKMQSTLHGLYQKGRGMKKKSDPTHQYIHSKITLQTYLAEVERYAKWLKDQGIKMRCSEQEAAEQVPRYLQGLGANREIAQHHTHGRCGALQGAPGDWTGHGRPPTPPTHPCASEGPCGCSEPAEAIRR